MSIGRVLVPALFLIGNGCLGDPAGEVSSRAAASLQVTWVNVIGVSAIDNDLTKTNGQPQWNAGASSLQTIETSGYAEFSTGENTTHKAAGLSSDDSDRTLSDIDFAFHLKPNGTFDIVEGGVATLPGAGTYAAGDLFRVQAQAGVVTYWQNGGLVHTSAAVPILPLRVDSSLRTPGATIQNARMDSLDLWTNEVGVAVVGSDLSKTAPETAWNAGASSLTSLEVDGYVEFTTGERTTDKLAGLNRVDNNQGFSDIDFGIFLRSNGRFAVRENGDDPVGSAFGPYQAGDVFRVEVSGGAVTYARNGTVFYTSALAPVFPLYLDSSLRTPGATILDAAVVPAGVCGWTETLSQTPQANANLNMATHGDRLVIANGRGFSDDPYVSVYRRSGTGWVREQIVDQRAGDDELGPAVDIEGDTIAVGTYDDDEFGFYEGSVRTYRYDGAAWNPDQLLGGCTELFSSEQFGWSVALHGDLLVASSMSIGDRVYVYRRGPSGFELEAVLQPSGGDVSLYGWRLAVGGNRIFVSAAGRWSGGIGAAGAVYVYRYAVNRPDPPGPPTCDDPHPGKWIEEALLESPNPQSQDYFASGLAINSTGTLLLAGNTQRGDEDEGGGRDPNGPGEAYVFARQAGAWVLRQTLTGSDTVIGDDFGEAVAFGGPDAASPSFAVVGAPNFGPGDGSIFFPPGAAYLFTRDGDAWTETERLDSPNAPESERAGDAVAASDTEAFVNQHDPSAVHVHEVSVCQ